jgi:hypothetical protein
LLIIRKPEGAPAQFACVFDVLFRHAMGCYAQNSGTSCVDRLQLMHGGDARQQKHSDLGAANHINGGFDPLKVGMRDKALVEART